MACRTLGGLALTAGTAALRASLDEDRRRPGELFDGLLVVDRWERVVFVNGVFRELPGWSREDPFGRALNGLPGGALVSRVEVGCPGGLQWEEHLLPPIEDHGAPVALAALPFGLDDGASEGGRVVFLRDLRATRAPADGTGRLLALAMRIAHAADELEGAVERAGPEGGGVELDQRLLDRFEEEVREAGEMVRKALKHCGTEDRRQAVDVNQLVEEILRRHRGDLEAERIRVFSFLRPELPPIPADRLELLRAYRLLVSVARESLRPRGGSLTVRTWTEEGWVFGAVSDDGAGFRQGREGRRFEPLFHSPEPAADPLDEVRDIAVRYGGRLNAESRPGIWTRYTLMLPVERRQEACTEDGALPPAVEVRSAAGGGLEVLVVDDNAALRSVLKRYLERRGHSVTEAKDGEDALRIVEERAFDRVIVDVQMPGRDGPSFFTSLAGVAPEMQARTIFMTGGFLEDGTERFIADSGRPSIKKPFDLTEMAKTVEA